MINLLPPDLKRDYIYARRNVGLRKWVVVFVIALLGLGAMATYGLVSFRQTGQDYQAQINKAEQHLEVENYDQVQARIQDIGNNFKLVVKVLSQEILFSKLLAQVGTAMPPNSSLAELNISQTEGAIDITANAVDYATATQVQVNLSDPANKIFSKADIVSINCNSKPGDDGKANPYPCRISIKALFAEDNPFLFINSRGKTPWVAPNCTLF